MTTKSEDYKRKIAALRSIINTIRAEKMDGYITAQRSIYASLLTAETALLYAIRHLEDALARIYQPLSDTTTYKE